MIRSIAVLACTILVAPGCAKQGNQDTGTPAVSKYSVARADAQSTDTGADQGSIVSISVSLKSRLPGGSWRIDIAATGTAEIQRDAGRIKVYCTRKDMEQLQGRVRTTRFGELRAEYGSATPDETVRSVRIQWSDHVEEVVVHHLPTVRKDQLDELQRFLALYDGVRKCCAQHVVEDGQRDSFEH